MTPQTQRRVHRCVLTIALVALSTAPPRAQQKPPEAGTPRDLVLPAARRFSFAHGLPVTMVPFGQVPKVAIRLVVAAGNVYESKDEVWLADLTGQLMSDRTPPEPARPRARRSAG